jgi:pimeloyl-ACP methyl ester carboxylesterase
MPAFPGTHLLLFWGGVQCGFNGFEHAPAEYAHAVQCPALLLHGEKDVRVTQEQAQAVYGNLAGAKQLVLLPGAGHDTCLSTDPQLWKRSIARFLNSLQ